MALSILLAPKAAFSTSSSHFNFKSYKYGWWKTFFPLCWNNSFLVLWAVGDYIQAIPLKWKVATHFDMNQVQAKFSSHWLEVSKIKHILASYTGRIQMEHKMKVQVWDQYFWLTDAVIDLLILLSRCWKLKSSYTSQPNILGNHFSDSCYLASFFQVESCRSQFPKDRRGNS